MLEVDLVLAFDDGRIVAVEVKAGSRIDDASAGGRIAPMSGDARDRDVYAHVDDDGGNTVRSVWTLLEVTGA